ncbi:MAG: hypothetical protein WD875_02655 [Pirellulales bacterium]
MNCDQVFDILTRGPFPSGAASDLAVQRHLGACAECRQLAEALRPALDLIHESVPPEESWGLPGYWDDVPPGERPPVRPGEQHVQRHSEQPVTVKQRPQLAVRRLRLPTEAKRRRSAHGDRWRIVTIAALAGAFAALAVIGVERAVAPGRDSVSNSTTAALVSIVWPPKIEGQEHDGITAVATVASLAHDLQSCGRCHMTDNPHWDIRPATNALATVCFECHEFKSAD